MCFAWFSLGFTVLAVFVVTGCMRVGTLLLGYVFCVWVCGIVLFGWISFPCATCFVSVGMIAFL